MESENKRLRIWITENFGKLNAFTKRFGYSHKQVSLIVNEHRPVTNEFVGKFIRTFGLAEAVKVFTFPVPNREQDAIG